MAPKTSWNEMTSLSPLYVLVVSNVLRPTDDDAETTDGSIVQGLPAVGGGAEPAMRQGNAIGRVRPSV